MSTIDHLRLVYIQRLWTAPRSEGAYLLTSETDEEVRELKRVALEAQHFEAAAWFARVLKDRLAAAIPLCGERPSYTEGIALDLAKQMARQKDELIRTIARRKLGIEIDDMDLARRLKCYPPENRDDGTLWSLDDKPLVMIWPPTVAPIEDGSSLNRMQATFQYRIYE